MNLLWIAITSNLDPRRISLPCSLSVTILSEKVPRMDCGPSPYRYVFPIQHGAWGNSELVTPSQWETKMNNICPKWLRLVAAMGVGYMNWRFRTNQLRASRRAVWPPMVPSSMRTRKPVVRDHRF